MTTIARMIGLIKRAQVNNVAPVRFVIGGEVAKEIIAEAPKQNSWAPIEEDEAIKNVSKRQLGTVMEIPVFGDLDDEDGCRLECSVMFGFGTYREP